MGSGRVLAHNAPHATQLTANAANRQSGSLNASAMQLPTSARDMVTISTLTPIAPSALFRARLFTNRFALAASAGRFLESSRALRRCTFHPARPPASVP
jgi:hypothetical protein